jgi:hypothetical protein
MTQNSPWIGPVDFGQDGAFSKATFGRVTLLRANPSGSITLVMWRTEGALTIGWSGRASILLVQGGDEVHCC